MPGTFSQLLFHAVYSTKHRNPWITPAIGKRLYPYIGGIVREEKGTLLAINGIEDHVHLYFRWRTDRDIASLMCANKAKSSGWIHNSFPTLQDFAWQDGYGIFSVSKSQGPKVKAYIQRQREHHKKMDFKAELLKLLRAHEIEFDERYVFD